MLQLLNVGSIVHALAMNKKAMLVHCFTVPRSAQFHDFSLRATEHSRWSNPVTEKGLCVQHYKPPDDKPSEYQTIPLSKIEDFGVHANSYYSLDITYFKSSLDAVLLDQLWGKYWVNTLASSPLLATRDLTAGQMRDIGAILEAFMRPQAFKHIGCACLSLPVLWPCERVLVQGTVRVVCSSAVRQNAIQ